MERCRMCRKSAVYIAVLHDGARIPYCRKHLPDWHGLNSGLWNELIERLLARPEALTKAPRP
jgi:hypothetical protein